MQTIGMCTSHVHNKLDNQGSSAMVPVQMQSVASAQKQAVGFYGHALQLPLRAKSGQGFVWLRTCRPPFTTCKVVE